MAAIPDPDTSGAPLRTQAPGLLPWPNPPCLRPAWRCGVVDGGRRRGRRRARRPRTPGAWPRGPPSPTSSDGLPCVLLSSKEHRITLSVTPPHRSGNAYRGDFKINPRYRPREVVRDGPLVQNTLVRRRGPGVVVGGPGGFVRPVKGRGEQ